MFLHAGLKLLESSIRGPFLWKTLLFVVALRGPGWAADLLEQEEAAMKAAVEHVAPMVVQVQTVGGLETVDDVLVGTGPTTGLLLTEDGYLVSSSFNFAQIPTSILVTLPGGVTLAAKVVAQDQSRKVVLLKVKPPEPLPVPQAVPKAELRVGQWALAVGRTYDPAAPNFSTGIISALNRIWGLAVQTDAKVSPANYGGPLIDIRGRVIGVLVPLSADAGGKTAGSKMAGAELYDSGIGFAIPLVDILAHLPRLKEGEDLHTGLLGVTLKSRGLYTEPPVIGSCPARSPAAEAGLQVNDKILSIGEIPVRNQAQLKYALTPRLAGETITVVVLRHEKEITAEVTLTDRIDPYVLPFLGILPQRDSDTGEDPLIVRHVFADSPADRAGIRNHDRLTTLNGKPLANADAWREQLALHEPEDILLIGLKREGEELEVKPVLATTPNEIPGELPPSKPPMVEVEDEEVETGIVDIKIPEMPNRCVAYVPAAYSPEIPYGVIVWLAPPGRFQPQELVDRWSRLCDQRHLIVLAPQPADADRWQITELEFIRKALDELMRRYRVDPHRVVAHGYQAGSAVAYRLAFLHRDVIRGVAACDAGIPRRTSLQANDPIDRLAFYLHSADGSRLHARMKKDTEGLVRLKFPVTTRWVKGSARYLNETERDELARWIDTLDCL